MKRFRPRILTAAVLGTSLLLGACSDGAGEKTDTAAAPEATTTAAAESEDAGTTDEETSAEESPTEEENREETGQPTGAQETAEQPAPEQNGAAAADGEQTPEDGGSTAQTSAPAPHQDANGGTPAPAPTPQQGQEQGAATTRQSAPDQPQGHPARQAIINGMAGATAASGHDVSAVPPETLNRMYGCLADSLISQDATNLTNAIANQQNGQLSEQDSAAMQTAAQTCYSRLMGQLGG